MIHFCWWSGGFCAILWTVITSLWPSTSLQTLDSTLVVFFHLDKGERFGGQKPKISLQKNGEGAKILSHILASYGLILLNSDELGELASQRNLLNLRQFTSDIQSITESRCALVNGWCFALGELPTSLGV